AGLRRAAGRSPRSPRVGRHHTDIYDSAHHQLFLDGVLGVPGRRGRGRRSRRRVRVRERPPLRRPDRIAIGGHSMGGFIAILAASREPRVRAVVSLAGGFTWKDGNKDTGWSLVERAWREAAKRITAPVLIMWSKNDYNLDPGAGREL